jgi:hypothetical protein
MIPNIYSFKYNEIKNNTENYKIIILGSSHSFFGVNPEYFEDSALNIANVSQDLKYDKFILDKSLVTLTNVKTVILPISYFSLLSDTDSGIESWRKYFYIHWFGYPISELFNINSFSVITSYPSKIALLSLINKYFLKNNFEPDWSSSGWGLNYSDENQSDLILTGKKAAERHHIKDTSFYDRNILLLDEIVAICKKRNIKLLLFTPPAYTSYREHLSQKRLDQMTSLLRNITEINENVTYINLIDDERFIKNDYHDADHLNHTGAKKLSIILNEYLSMENS